MHVIRLVRPSSCLGLIAAFALLCGPRSEALAKRHPAAPSTGLRAVAYAKPPPDFTFAGANGPTHVRDLAGRPVVINFWATWCEPCEAELAAFARLHDAYGARVTLIAISDEAPGIARAALAAHGVDATVVEDPERAIFARYTIGPIPVTIVLGPDAAVDHVSVGELDWDELRDALDPLVRTDLTPQPGSSKLRVNAGTPAS